MDPELTTSPAAVAIVLLLGTASLLAGGEALRRIVRFEPLIPYNPRRPVPWMPLDVGLVLAAYLLPVLAAALLAGTTSETVNEALRPNEFALGLMMNAAIQVGVAAFALAVLRFRARATWIDMGLVPGKLAADVRLGLMAFLTMAVPIYALQLGIHHLMPQQDFHPIVELLKEHPNHGLFLISGLAAVVVAPVTEEIVFRLLLQGCLEGIEDRLRGAKGVVFEPPNEEHILDAPIQRLENDSRPPNPFASPLAPPGPSAQEAPRVPPIGRIRGWIPIVGTSLLFAALHKWPDQIPLFIYSLTLGYVYHRTHRILPSIVMHLALNLTSLTLLWLALSGQE
jgi:membrane protease YdiL (CAAX protease family)